MKNVPALSAPKSLLLSCPGGILPTIWMSAVFEPLKKTLAETRIFLLVDKKNASVFNDHPLLDGLFAVGAETRDEEIAQYFKRLQIDVVAHVVFDERVARAAETCKIQNIVAFEDRKKITDKNAFVAERSEEEKKEFRRQHPVFAAFDLLKPLGLCVPEKSAFKLSLSVSDSERHGLRDKLKDFDMTFDSRYAVICLDTGRNGHTIDPKIFAKVAKYMHGQKKDLPILLATLEKESLKTSGRMLDFTSAAPGINLMSFMQDEQNGALSPAQATELLKHADICITGDNAISYLADFVGCPLVTLVVDTPEERHFPRSVKAETVYTSAQKFFFFEPRGFFHWRASHSFSFAKICDAIDYVSSFEKFGG